MKNLARFLEVFDIDQREKSIDIFVAIQENQAKWRVRELIACQIDKLSEIFTVETTFRIIFPLNIKLCNDQVAIVREEAARNIYFVVLRLYYTSSVYK